VVLILAQVLFGEIILAREVFARTMIHNAIQLVILVGTVLAIQNVERINLIVLKIAVPVVRTNALIQDK
jgi:NAD-dependent SIR2 family protein deacetylase